MSTWSRFTRGWVALFRKERVERELDEELRGYVDAAAAEGVRGGESPGSALRAARVELGGAEAVKEEVRSVGWESFVESIWQDVRYGARNLRSHPGFTLVAVLSLAIGIGANTALFTLINDVLLKSLPVPHPEELVLFESLDSPKRMRVSTSGSSHRDLATGRFRTTSFSYPAFERMRDANQTLNGMFAFAPIDQLNVNVDGQAEVASGQYVSGGYYETLQVATVAGRTLNDEDQRPGAPAAAVITWRYWQRRFAGDPRTVGKQVMVNNIPFTIVGITPANFAGTLQVGESPDVTLPITLEPQLDPGPRNDLATGWNWWVRIIGRRQPGVTMEQVRTQLEPAFQAAVMEGYAQALGEPRFRGRLESRSLADASRLLTDSGAQGLMEDRRSFAAPLRVLLAMVVLVLLIGCANVANLLLARATIRTREIAVRLALGAARRRLVRQLLTESLLLAALAGLTGVAIAYAIKEALLALRPWGFTVGLELALDTRVLAFTAALSAVTAVVFGLAPALRATHMQVNPALTQAGTSMLRGRSRLARSLVAAQVALALPLLLAAGLFTRTLQNLNRVDLGFDADNLLVFRADPLHAGYKDEAINPLYTRLLERLAAVPGVRGVTLSRHPLLSFSSRTTSAFAPGRAAQDVKVQIVAPSFFATLRIPMLAGRTVSDADDSKAPKVAVISQTAARRLFEQANPLGRRFWFGNAPEGEGYEVIGVTGDAKYTDVRSDIPATVYVPYRQSPISQANFEVRTAADPGALIGAVRAAVREVEPRLPLFDVKTQRQYAAESIAQERLFAESSAALGGVALLLAVIGLYGVMSYTVSRRASEIGIRMALGAQRSRVLWMVLRESLALVLLGATLGALASFGAFRLAEKQLVTMLYGLRPGDPTSALLAMFLLLLAAGVAAYWPARRAASVDPMVALRHE